MYLKKNNNKKPEDKHVMVCLRWVDFTEVRSFILTCWYFCGSSALSPNLDAPRPHSSTRTRCCPSALWGEAQRHHRQDVRSHLMQVYFVKDSYGQKVWNVLVDHGTFSAIGDILKEISLRRKKRIITRKYGRGEPLP